MTRRAVTLLLGASLLAMTWVTPPPPGMDVPAWRTAGVALVMAAWWITETLPLAVTALLPLVLFPPLRLASISDTAAPYANPVIFLFLGGFILAAALARSGLHRRMALAIVAASGTSPPAVMAGFMVATAFLSMWVSNTATTLMVLPIALSVLSLDAGAVGAAKAAVEEEGSGSARTVGETRPPDVAGKGFACALVLAIAYAANIGGMATLIGTPPNAFLAGFMEEAYGVRVGFVGWMTMGVPLVLVALPLAWLVLARGLVGAAGPDTAAVHEARAAMGPASRAEWIVGAIAAATAAAWLTRPLLESWVPGLSDAGIAMTGALLLFLAPPDPDGTPIMTWDEVEGLPWGLLILFGGGLSLAAGIQGSGLAAWIGSLMSRLADWPSLLVIGLVAGVVVYLTEITSNTATAATFVPIAAAVAIGAGLPAFELAAAVALAASAAFMMPVATAPNAIVYGSGLVPIRRMVAAGFWLNLAFVVLVSVTVRLLGGLASPG